MSTTASYFVLGVCTSFRQQPDDFSDFASSSRSRAFRGVRRIFHCFSLTGKVSQNLMRYLTILGISRGVSREILWDIHMPWDPRRLFREIVLSPPSPCSSSSSSGVPQHRRHTHAVSSDRASVTCSKVYYNSLHCHVQKGLGPSAISNQNGRGDTSINTFTSLFFLSR